MELNSRSEYLKTGEGSWFWKVYDSISPEKQRSFLRCIIELMPSENREEIVNSIMDARRHG